jgi:hypothetical protein
MSYEVYGLSSGFTFEFDQCFDKLRNEHTEGVQKHFRLKCINELKYSVMWFCILCEHNIDIMYMYNQGCCGGRGEGEGGKWCSRHRLWSPVGRKVNILNEKI